MASRDGNRECWPELPYELWRDTCSTLHLKSQIIGKIRLSNTPWLNHSWHVTLYVTGRGLTTSLIPRRDGAFQIDFDFVDHLLRLETSNARRLDIPLREQSVAEFFATVSAALANLGIGTKVNEWPNEIPDRIRFSEDRAHSAYDPEYVNRFWKALVQIDRVFEFFRTGYIGKCSPVHFFWGSFDLAVTRFSGRPAPLHPGGVPNLPDEVTREAYSHEVSSAGFWPGGGGPVEYPAFYSYTYPEPAGFRGAIVRPEGAFYSEQLREFILPYEVVRTAGSPDNTLLEFLQSTYEAAANAANWDRAALECPRGEVRIPRIVSPA